ncbi:MAG: hypothetical protein HY560_06750 [Gemmatimonadetes bacterium]|nr:hypothetical protein [Gemmatimonadota bacterium]
MRSRSLAAVLFALLPVPAAAQAWNSPEVQALIGRAILRRTSTQADSGLRSFRARAHGFVFFLGQLGEGFTEPPRLVKSDQLELEVYWQAPGLSKQIIIGRRDRRELPTDIQYHRDHLGIVQNNFSDSIRFGEGDEVRDVPHPLAPSGPGLYDYALVDSLALELPERTVRVYQVQTRPRDYAVPRVVGELFLDVDRAELVRFRFQFTPPAYRDRTLEDITVVLENGLWFGRHWLPRRQEIEIRRRTSWLDLPARGIIRGRWEIGSYQFNLPLAPGVFNPFEPEIVSAPRAVRDSFPWAGRLDAAISEAAGPVQAADLEMVRAEIERVAGSRALTGLPRTRPAFGSVSDMLHVNRVEGVAPGFGWLLRPGSRRVELRGWGSYGFSDRRLKARGTIGLTAGRVRVELRAAREVRDIGGEPVISPVLNSFLAQERGLDYGDYVLLEHGSLSLGWAPQARGALSLTAGIERPTGMAVVARPAAGQYRANPDLGGAARGIVRLELVRPSGLVLRTPELGGRAAFEAGLVSGGSRYLRVRADVRLAFPAGPTQVALTGSAGWGSPALPNDREFVLGGRGTLPGDAFRAWVGRRNALARLEWKLPVPFLALPLGPYGSTGRTAVLVPFVAAGAVGGTLERSPAVATEGVRPAAGAALEMFHGPLRAEAAWSFRGRRGGVAVDVRSDLWPIL